MWASRIRGDMFTPTTPAAREPTRDDDRQGACSRMIALLEIELLRRNGTMQTSICGIRTVLVPPRRAVFLCVPHVQSFPSIRSSAARGTRSMRPNRSTGSSPLRAAS
jgi:hypothetical protein